MLIIYNHRLNKLYEEQIKKENKMPNRLDQFFYRQIKVYLKNILN